MGLQTLWSQNYRNAAQLYSFIKKAVSNTIVEEDLHWEAVEDRSKRQLPTTIMLERIDVRKKRLETDSERLKEVPERLILERPCLQKPRQWVTRPMQNRELLVLKHFKHRHLSKLHLHSLHKMLIFCRIIVVQKILWESQALSLRHRHWCGILTEKSSFRKCLKTQNRLTEIASLVCWTSLFYCLINQSEFEVNKMGLL